MIGTRLKRMRLAQGLTQKELAAPRYTHAYVSSIEAGRRHPSRDALDHFASKLGVSSDELLTGRPADLQARLELRLLEAKVALSDGRIEEADESLRAIAREAKRYRLPRVEAKAEEGFGLLHERRGQPEEALNNFLRAEELLRSEPPTEWVDAVGGKARAFEALGDVRYAIFILESLLDLLERDNLRDPDAMSRIHASLVFAYLEAGIYRKAGESAGELMSLAPRLIDPLRVAQMHMNVSRLFFSEGRIEDAQRSLRRAEETYRLLNLKTEMGGAHLALGYVASRSGNLEEARSELEQAVAVFEETSNESDLVRALNELARVARLEGHRHHAADVLARSITLIGTSNTPILAWAHRELGLAIADEDPSAAEKNFQIAIELYERSEQSFEIAMTYRALGDLFHMRGESDAACDAYRTGIMALEIAM